VEVRTNKKHNENNHWWMKEPTKYGMRKTRDLLISYFNPSVSSGTK
jgi:hypothetical protein